MSSDKQSHISEWNVKKPVRVGSRASGFALERQTAGQGRLFYSADCEAASMATVARRRERPTRVCFARR